MQNGELDTDVLAPIEPHSPYLLVNPATDLIGYAGLQWMAKGAIPSFLRICQKFRAETGKAVFLREAFRSLDTQKYYEAHPQGGTVAKAGTSPHGWGLAVDVWSGIDTSFTSTEHVAFERIAKAEGWTNTGRNFGEPWHFEINGADTIDPSGTGTTTPVEDDMPLSDADATKVADEVLGRLLASNAWTELTSRTKKSAVNSDTLITNLAANPQATWAYQLANGYTASGTVRSAAAQVKIPLN